MEGLIILTKPKVLTFSFDDTTDPKTTYMRIEGQYQEEDNIYWYRSEDGGETWTELTLFDSKAYENAFCEMLGNGRTLQELGELS